MDCPAFGSSGFLLRFRLVWHGSSLLLLGTMSRILDLADRTALSCGFRPERGYSRSRGAFEKGGPPRLTEPTKLIRETDSASWPPPTDDPAFGGGSS